MRHALALPFALLLAAGCGDSLGSHDVELTLSASAFLTDATVATVRTLEIGAGTGGHGSATMIPLTRPLARNERLTIHATNDHGTLAIGVIARDASSNIVAVGDDTLMLDGTGPKTLTIVLKAPATTDGEVVHVAPAAYTLFVGQTITLAADSAVTWSVDEGATGGSVDDNGTYTAPSTAGTYHVVATSTAFFGHSARATVDVRASGIAPYVGQLGGAGTKDGPPGVGRLVNPNGMTVIGNTLYFTTQDKLVRALDLKSGALSTIAGAIDAPAPIDGTGAGAHFADALGIVGDGLGNLYVADGNNAAIRKVEIASGKVTTFAGQLGVLGFADGAPGTAKLGGVGGIAFDGAGSIYFSDSNCRIGKVDLATQTVSTVIGRTPGTTGMCVEADGTGAAAGFASTPSLVWDGAGHIYTAEDSVRRIDVATATVTTVAKSVTAFGSLAWDGHNVWTFGIGPVTQVAPDGTATQLKDPSQPNGAFNLRPTSGAFGADGTFYIGTVDYIATLDPTSAKVTVVAGAPSTQDYQFYGASSFGDRAQTRLQGITAFTLAPDGTFYGKAGDGFFKLDPATGTSEKMMVDPTVNYPCCAAMVADGSGNLYTSGYDGTLRRIALAGGGIATVAGNSMGGYAEGVGTAAQFSQLGDLVLDGAGNAYVMDVYNYVIRKVVLASGQTSLFAGKPQMAGFADGTGSAAQFNIARGLVYDGAGALYVTDDNNSRIRKVTVPGAVVTTIAGNGMFGAADGAAMSATFSQPSGLAFDAGKQNLFIADTLNNTLRKLSLATGTVSTIAGTLGQSYDAPGPLPGALNQPDVLRVSSSGDILALTRREASVVQIRLP